VELILGGVVDGLQLAEIEVIEADHEYVLGHGGLLQVALGRGSGVPGA